MFNSLVKLTTTLITKLYKPIKKCPNCKTPLFYEVIKTREVDHGTGFSHLSSIIGKCACGYEEVIKKERVETTFPETNCYEENI